MGFIKNEMANKITTKEVQVHFQCSCGNSSVFEETYPIKWMDLSKAKIVRRKDKKTGKPFLLANIFMEVCLCSDKF